MHSVVLSKINKSYGSRQVLKDINFQVHSNTIHGLLGPNGAGKSTIMKIMAGLLNPDSGEVFINGLNRKEADAEIKNQVGMLPEAAPLYQEMRVRQYLKFVAQLHGLHTKEALNRVEYVIEVLSLGLVADRVIGNLSKGYKQKVGVAQAIVFNPSIVILDEPTSGLDPEAIIQMRELLGELKKNHTIILSSHLLHEVSLACDDVTIIGKGQILKSGPMEEILRPSFDQSWIIEIGNSKPEDLDFLKKLTFVRSFKVEPVGLFTFVEVTLTPGEDHRKKLAREFFDRNLDILSFKESHYDLERVFLQTTHNSGLEAGR